MKGLKLAYEYFKAFGAPMIQKKFPEQKCRIACGLVGEGSEAFGFDDEISRDHDFGPGFCIWLTDDDYENYGNDLMRAYLALPSEFGGFKARKPVSFGDQRLGVMRISDFYYRFLGLRNAPQTLMQWRGIAETSLATATNGNVFADPLGEFTSFRKVLLAFYPEDIRLKKIAARAAKMAQAGQYNYPRLLVRGEYVAAQCALAEFINAACSIVYLLNKKYMPYYKWAHHGLKNLDILSDVYGMLGDLDSCDKQQKADVIELISITVILELKKQELSTLEDDFLLNHCPQIMRKIQDQDIRSMHVMAE